MGRISTTLFAIALGALLSASKCESDPPPAEQGGPASDVAVTDSVPSSSSAAGENAQGVVDPRDLLLAELSSRLDQVKTAKSQEMVVSGGGIALEPLLGMTRSELRAALGAPRSCEKVQVARTGGAGLTVAPCQTDDDWFYSFYHLPADMPGGGPELLLQFDDKGTCVGARWMSTQ